MVITDDTSEFYVECVEYDVLVDIVAQLCWKSGKIEMQEFNKQYCLVLHENWPNTSIPLHI